MRHVHRVGVSKLGWRFYIQGLGPTLLRAFPTNAVLFVVYELSLHYLNML